MNGLGLSINDKTRGSRQYAMQTKTNRLISSANLSAEGSARNADKSGKEKESLVLSKY